MPCRLFDIVSLFLPGVVVALGLAAPSSAAERMLDPALHHLRSGSEREWTEFPEQAEADRLTISFEAHANRDEHALRLRHRDVKQAWKLLLNGRELDRLPQDENDTVSFWPLPAGSLAEGQNALAIVPAGGASDDILVGDVRLFDRPLAEVLSAATLGVTVTDADTAAPLPCRLTIVDEHGSLMTLGTRSGGALAVRPGVVYTADGRARVALPSGKYKLYAGRGFEYSVDSTTVELPAGETAQPRLKIRREVRLDGYVACDTHCHTLTFSGHGDATQAERMITLAGEGVELPIATDHNVQIDYDAVARAAGVRRWFTPVVGNEVTTARLGHFNVFPIDAGAAVIDASGADWPAVFDSIFHTPGVRVAVLNHARDLHGGFRPFAPENHIGLVGERLDGRELRANAMEVVNSGALRTDRLQLVRDWFGLLNRGLGVSPVGSSDSHDVARHIVGQGRTYVRCVGTPPDAIDVAATCQNLAEGRVLVSMGLVCDLQVDGRHGPGDLAPATRDVDVRVRVLAPSWTHADEVTVFANGIAIRHVEIPPRAGRSLPAGVQFEDRFVLPRPKRDVFLVAVATGPGVTEPFWPIAKSYQPSSPEWTPYVLGVSGAVRLDAVGSGSFTSAYEYARQLFDESGGDPGVLVAKLALYDESVAVQAASVLAAHGRSPLDETVVAALRGAGPAVRRGVDAYRAAWRESQTAAAKSGK